MARHLINLLTRALSIALAFLAISNTALGAVQVVPHVIHISVDGLSSVYLSECLRTNAAAYPNFQRLINEGASTMNARCDYARSETIPNHTTMLLGRPVSQPIGLPDTVHHGITFNVWYDTNITFHNSGNTNVDYCYSTFDVVHDHGLETAFFAGKDKLGICTVSYDDTNGRPDLIGDDDGPNKVDYSEIIQWINSVVDCVALMTAVTNYLADTAPDYLFLHLADMDYVGHNTGWGSTRWCAELAKMDACLGSLFMALERNPSLDGQTALVISTDHGGGDPWNNHIYPERPLNYTIPLFVWGPGWPAGANAYDLFANRFDPGTNRVDYVAPRQPLRNGDGANLAMTLLGLPPIPGSFIHPVIGAKMLLTFSNGTNGLRVAWPSDSADFRLETSDQLEDKSS